MRFIASEIAMPLEVNQKRADRAMQRWLYARNEAIAHHYNMNVEPEEPEAASIAARS